MRRIEATDSAAIAAAVPDAGPTVTPAAPAVPWAHPPTYCDTASVGSGAGHIAESESSLPTAGDASSEPPEALEREVGVPMERAPPEPPRRPFSRSTKRGGWNERVEAGQSGVSSQ